MANPTHLQIINSGYFEWISWRKHFPTIKPDLSRADLRQSYMLNFDLRGADLRGANLSESSCRQTDFTGADLRGADFTHVDLYTAKLSGADLSGADLQLANLGAAGAGGANFHKANLFNTLFIDTILRGANFTGASVGQTVFTGCDLSEVQGLDTIVHEAPSSVGIDTLYKSAGKLPDSFLRGCGVPDLLMSYLPSLLSADQVIQFYSCFISYSTKDDDFARRLYSRLRDEQVRVWFAPEDVEGGKKLHEQIDQAIRIYDKLLLILSPHSISSEWVMTEIRKARRAEVKEKRRKLFPIRLMDFEAIKEWECFDADSGNDLAVEVREYYIPDFSGWKDHDAFEAEFPKLLRDLRGPAPPAAESQPGGDPPT